MVRTVISLDERDKKWLDRQAARRNVARTALLREAIALLRREAVVRPRSHRDVVERTRGIWKRGDALVWQNGLRDAW
jgi:hypothetical protein